MKTYFELVAASILAFLAIIIPLYIVLMFLEEIL